MYVRLMTLTTVMRMQTAVTQKGVSTILATLATLEMESSVQVSLSKRVLRCPVLRKMVEHKLIATYTLY